MMEQEKKSTNYPRKIARIVLKSILFLFLFIVLVFIILLTPPAQRFLTGKAESFLQNKLKTRVEIGSISFGLSGNINLQNVYIEDRTKDTLLSGGTIKAHLNYLRLFSNEVQITVLDLVNHILKLMDSCLVPDIRNEVSHEIRHQYLSAAKAREVLGWNPIFNLDQGLARTAKWYTEFLRSDGPSRQ